MKPNFLYIGPDKSGSTWLYELFFNHPECYVPKIKDIYFFDRYFYKGPGWYLSFFENIPNGCKAVGELSHDYLFSKEAAQRIANFLPGVKLITCLRNPVDRAFSQYLYLIRSGMTKDSFERALEKFPSLINNSMYYRHLSEYFALFPKSHIKVLFFDKLIIDPKIFAMDVFKYLDISFVESDLYDKQILPASRPRSLALARITKFGANLVRNLGFLKLLAVLKSSPIIKNVLYVPYGLEDRPFMDTDTKKRLTEIFLEDVHLLENLLEVDLGRWYTEV